MFGRKAKKAAKKERSYENGRISVSDKDIEMRLRFQGLSERDLGVIMTWSYVLNPKIDLL